MNWPLCSGNISGERMDERVYKIGVALTPGITAETAIRIEESGIELKDFFEIQSKELSQALGISGSKVFDKVKREEALFRARKEIDLIERHNISAHFITDDTYPFLLRETPDAPVILFQLGETDLNSDHFISVVGTRRPTSYADSFCKTFIKDLGEYFPDLVVVSGLAYGVDSMAHKAALENNLPTIAVLAHGLDTIYPAANRELAKHIIKHGGSLISEYSFGTTPFQKRFLERNRIVAGISEITVVVESPIKGGAMNTANSAFSYSREVGAVPGRVSDPMSEGCNTLIRKDKAHLISGAADVIELTGWRPAGITVTPKQRNLFPELSGAGRTIYDYLRQQTDSCSLDMLHLGTHIPVAELMSTLTELEFDGVIIRQPGNRYSLA